MIEAAVPMTEPTPHVVPPFISVAVIRISPIEYATVEI